MGEDGVFYVGKHFVEGLVIVGAGVVKIVMGGEEVKTEQENIHGIVLALQKAEESVGDRTTEGSDGGK